MKESKKSTVIQKIVTKQYENSALSSSNSTPIDFRMIRKELANVPKSERTEMFQRIISTIKNI